MKLRLSNLPPDAEADDIRELLDNSDDIVSVTLVEDGETDKPVAIIEMSDDAAGEGAVELLNGRIWKNVNLRADKLLY